jgi:hypothetical protein
VAIHQSFGLLDGLFVVLCPEPVGRRRDAAPSIQSIETGIQLGADLPRDERLA